MPYRLEEAHGKYDNAVLPQLLNDKESAHGHYFRMAAYNRALFLVSVGALQVSGAASDKVYLRLWCAEDEAGGGEVPLAGAAAITGHCHIVANNNVQAALLDLDDLDDTVSEVTINGVTFTHNTGLVADRDFANRAGLIALINDPELGVEGVVATAHPTDGDQIILDTVGRGDYTITLSSDPHDDILCSTRYAIALLEVKDAVLPANKPFVGICIEAATDVSKTGLLVNAICLRGGSRWSVNQRVAARYNR